MRRPLRLLLAALVLGTASCNPKLRLEAEPPHIHRFAPVSSDEMAEVGPVDWGIALSGGGLRSASFQLGVLKALFDQNILDSVQVVSTVSGGGYLGYWLFSSEYRKPSEGRFASRLFSDGNFNASVCNAAVTSNFYTFRRAVLNLHKPVTEYTEAIFRTYGQANYTWTNGIQRREPELFLHQLRQSERPQRRPFWVINATVVAPLPQAPDSSDGWEASLFEFTSLARGNAKWGYSPWQNGTSTPAIQAVAISGAAFARALAQTIKQTDIGYDRKEVHLADGGLSENLGAIALIRRRARNIIIVDSEHDPSYAFNSYWNLKRRLQHWGAMLSVPKIDTHQAGTRLEHGVMTGDVISHVQGDSYRGKVFYIKMSRPTSLDDTLKSLRVSGAEQRARIATRIRDTKGGDRRWMCDSLRTTPVDFGAFAAAEIGRFGLENPGAWTARHRFLGSLSRQFPHFTTSDQSHNVDRTAALAGLGFMIARDIHRSEYQSR